jgi:hypothetical protein
MRAPTVDVSRACNERGKDIYAVKLSSPAYEVNIAIPVAQVEKLKKVPTTPWLSGAMRLGRLAGAAVFWSCDKKKVSILIGHDDQTWDVGIFIPLGTFKTMLREIESCPNDSF